jgi:YrbI family 3-deoxy-D-manno-octulosonate 8-phosphate phosphatase
MKLEQRMQAIRLILSDVDGVMTDGAITFDNQGIETKSFHVRDGLGIRLWKRAGHQFGILTGRTSHVVKLRAAELEIDIVRQGFDDKLKAAMQILEDLELEPREACYIGDDLTDLRLMQKVGLAVSISDASGDVKAAAHLVTKAAGGKGAIRELIETLLKSQKRWDELLRTFVDS